MHDFIFVDDRPCAPLRPCSINYELFERTDIRPILLRVHDEPLGSEYTKMTEKFHQFYVDTEKSMSSEAFRFMHWCRERGLAPDSFCCMSEPRQEYWQAFARYLGLPAIKSETITALRQKPVMKEWIKNCGFEVADYREVTCIDDVQEFVGKFGYPVVLKPVDGWGTIFTEILENPQDINKAFEKDFERKMMVERFIPHTEYECCALIFKGRVLDVYPSLMPKPPLKAAYGALNANISVGIEHSFVPVKNLQKMVQRLADGFGLESGYLHMEFFASDDGQTLIISELALRYPGCEIAKNHGLALGFNMASAALDLYLGKKPNLAYTSNRCVGDLLLPYKHGMVTAVTSEEELMRLPGVIEAHIGVMAGQNIPKVGSASFNCSGWVFVEGDTPSKVEKLMQNVLASYELHTS